ncbi:MAG: methionyl-tRNA formyltransferase, partial [Paludibacteraceae bacterium]
KDTCRIDFSQTAAAVHNFVRGLSPYPAAWCNLTLNGQTYENVKVFAAEPGTGSQEQGQKGHILIPCGDGNYIDLLELQLPGKKRMDAKSLLNGLK